MFEQILCPTDGSDGADTALDHVLEVAAAHDATVHLINVVDTTRDSMLQDHSDIIEALDREAETIVEDAADTVNEYGVAAVSEVLHGEPYQAIVEYARSRDIDLIVMPTKGRRGLPRLLLGSTTERVVRRSTVPVLTIQPGEESMLRYPYRDILVPTDGSDCVTEALSTAVDVARVEAAGLHLLTVVSTMSLGVDVRTDIQQAELEASANTILDKAAESARAAGVEAVERTMEYGPTIHKAILSYIEANDIGLVVVGTHGRTGFDRYLLGSVTEYLIRTAPIPVLSVRKAE